MAKLAREPILMESTKTDDGYEEIYYLDDRGEPIDKDQAKQARLLQFDTEANHIGTVYLNIANQ